MQTLQTLQCLQINTSLLSCLDWPDSGVINTTVSITLNSSHRTTFMKLKAYPKYKL